MSDLGSKLKNLREGSKLLQIDVAKALQISNKTLSDYERNRSEPDIEMLKKLSVLYNVSIDSLLDNKLKQNNDMLITNEFQFALYKETMDINESKKQDLMDIIKIFKKQNINEFNSTIEREIFEKIKYFSQEDLSKVVGYVNRLNENYNKKDKSHIG